MKLLRRPRHSTVVAYLALFVSLGGTGYAAIKLPANSVGSREIKPRSVQTSDLAANTRLTKKNIVFRQAVTDVVLDPNTQAVVDALAGAVKGEKGDPGAAGATGAQGPAGPANVTVRTAVGPDVGQGSDTGTTARCEAGEKVVGGGARFEGSAGADGATLQMSMPVVDTEQAWAAFYTVVGASITGHAKVYALCAA